MLQIFYKWRDGAPGVACLRHRNLGGGSSQVYTVYICAHLTDGTLLLPGRCTSCLLSGACLDIADRRNGPWRFTICAWKVSPPSSIENSATLDNQVTFL